MRSLFLALALAGCSKSGDPGASGTGVPSGGTPGGVAGGTDGGTPGGAPTGGGTGCSIFPANNPWNTAVDTLPVHPSSDTWLASIGLGTYLHPDFGTEYAGAPNGIPFVIVPGDQPRVPVNARYDSESDPGPYPFPPDAPIEGGPYGDGDRHVIAVDLDDCKLYESWDSWPQNGGTSWEVGSAAIFDLTTNTLRPDYWTSADAAGLPIYPGLVKYEEVVEDGVIDHALRFTVSATQRAFIHPATHYASNSSDPALPPMGMRVRLKASTDCAGFSQEIQVVCQALKTYGMFLADNGSDWYVSGAPDMRWNDDALRDIRQLHGSDFEVVDTGPLIQ